MQITFLPFTEIKLKPETKLGLRLRPEQEKTCHKSRTTFHTNFIV